MVKNTFNRTGLCISGNEIESYIYNFWIDADRKKPCVF